MSKRAATHENAVVVGGSGDNAEFAGPGAVGQSDDTTLTPATRDASGNPKTLADGGPGSFAGLGENVEWVTDAAGRDPVTGYNPDPKNR